jgi:ATP-dependent Clp protease ATP-binding subunit ClpB
MNLNKFTEKAQEAILFHSLTMEHLVQIVGIQLERLQKLLADRKVSLSLTEAAKRHLAEKGFDPVYGARPLKRIIQRELQDPLAMKILQGEVSEGDKVQVNLRGGQLVLAGRDVRKSSLRQAAEHRMSGIPASGVLA